MIENPVTMWYPVLMSEHQSENQVSDRSVVRAAGIGYDAIPRPRGRPPTKRQPEPLNVDPDELVQSLFNGPPKKNWRYQQDV